MKKHFCKPRRIGLLDMDQPVEPIERTVQLNIGVESLFSGIHKLFKLKSKDDPKNKKEVERWEWACIDAISKTYGNKAWVEENFRPGRKVSSALSQKLAYRGKHQATPAATLALGEKIARDFYTRHNSAYQKYAKAVLALERKYENDPRADEEPYFGIAEVQEYLREANKLTPLFGTNFVGPEWLGGVFPVATKDYEVTYEVRHSSSNIDPLPEITPDDVVEGAKAIVEYLRGPGFEHYYDTTTFGMDYHFYKALNSEAEDHPDAHRLFHKLGGEGAEVGLNYDCFKSYSHLMEQLVTDIGGWLIQVTKE